MRGHTVRWLSLVAILMVSAFVVGCGSDDDSDSGSSKSSTSTAKSEAKTAPVSDDSAAVDAILNKVYGVKTAQDAVPAPVLKAMKVAAVDLTPEQLDKLKSCLRKPVCDTGTGGDLTVGLPIDDSANTINSQGQAISLMQTLRYPNVGKILMPDGQGKAQTGISNFRSMLSQNVKLIVGNFGLGASLGAVAKQAQQKGVIIAASNQGPAGLKPGDKDYIFTGNDLCQYGDASAKAVFEASGKPTGGSVALMTGTPGNPYYGGWNGCAKKTLKGANWTVAKELTTNWTPQGATQAASALLASGKDVDAIDYDADCTALVKAFLDAGKTPPGIVAAGVSPSCVKLWDKAKTDGKEFGAATGNAQVWNYAVGVTAGLDKLAGEDVETTITLELPFIPFDKLTEVEPEYASYPDAAVFQSLLPLDVTKALLSG